MMPNRLDSHGTMPSVVNLGDGGRSKAGVGVDEAATVAGKASSEGTFWTGGVGLKVWGGE